MKYFLKVLENFSSDTQVDSFNLAEIDQINPDQYDVLLYHTFPDQTKGHKFHPELVAPADELFLNFTGLKILVDSHDSGQANGFERFGNEYPRIKHNPPKGMNVVIALPSNIFVRHGWNPEIKTKRDVSIFCGMTSDGRYPHQIRTWVVDTLTKSFGKETMFTRIDHEEYRKFLERVKICITAPGFGESSDGVFDAFQAGAAVVAHSDMAKVRNFPFYDLREGVDYVLYSTPEELSARLKRLLVDNEYREHLGVNGWKALQKGLDIERSAQELEKYMREHI